MVITFIWLELYLVTRVTMCLTTAVLTKDKFVLCMLSVILQLKGVSFDKIIRRGRETKKLQETVS
jgi:hypothetical protein